MRFPGIVFMAIVGGLSAFFGAAVSGIWARRDDGRRMRNADDEARKVRDAVSRAAKDRQKVRTGDHRRDLRAMADKLREYADGSDDEDCPAKPV